jgi:hypothetical protein
MKATFRVSSLLQSGLILSAVGLLTQFIHYGFQAVVSPQLGGQDGEFGLVQSTIAFIGFLNMPLAIASQAITHYVARFHYSGDDARLDGLIAGCRNFLRRITVVGSVVAILLIKPLGDFFNIPRTSLTIIALFCVLGGLWSSYWVAICQGLGWFKRLALIGLVTAILRVAFGLPATRISPVAEWAVAASGVMLLANLILIFWRKDFPRRSKAAVSPWNREFAWYLLFTGAYIFGCYCFAQADLLVAGKYVGIYFSKAQMDAYGSAGLLARPLPMAAGPLLIVLFTYRSGRRHGEALREQMTLFGVYAIALISGAVTLYLLRNFCLGILHRDTPEAAAMIGRLAATMVFVGLIQALASWALASRWTRVTLLYGVLGAGYWLLLLLVCKTPAALVQVMPIAMGVAFIILLAAWLITMRRHQATAHT